MSRYEEFLFEGSREIEEEKALDFIVEPSEKGRADRVRKAKKKDMSVEEAFTTVSSANVKFETVNLAKSLCDKIKVAAIRIGDDVVLYLQDEELAIYKKIGKETLDNRVKRELTKMDIFAKREQINDMVEVIKQMAYGKEFRYEDVKNRIMVNNGVLTITDNDVEFVEISPDRLHLAPKPALKRIDVDFDEDLYKDGNEVVDNFLLSVMNDSPELNNFLLHALATPFIRRGKFEKAFVMYGSGSNGKSVLSDFMDYVYSERNVTSTELGEMKGFYLSTMDDGIVNWVKDIDRFDEWPNFKKVVTGEKLLVDIKFAQPVTKAIETQLFINSNILPKLGAKRDGGYIRRLEYIPFLQRYDESNRDDNILAKLKTPHNKNYMMSKLIHLTKELQQASGSWFTQNRPEEVRVLTEKQQNDDAQAIAFTKWVEEHLTITGSNINLEQDTGINLYNINAQDGRIGANIQGKFLFRTRIYQLYLEWCKLEGINKNLTKAQFETQLEESSWELNTVDKKAGVRGFYEIQKETENE